MEKYTTSEPFNDIAIICSTFNLENNMYVLKPDCVSLGRIEEDDTFISEDGKVKAIPISEIDEHKTDQIVYVCPTDINSLVDKYDVTDITIMQSIYLQEISSNLLLAYKDVDSAVYITDYKKISSELQGTTKKRRVVSPSENSVEEVIPEINVSLLDLQEDMIDIEEVERYVKKRILKNDSNIEDMVTTIAMNYVTKNPRRIRSMLSVGPTGSGKTETYKVIGEALGLPVTIYDCNTLSAAGYKGNDIEDMLIDAYEKSGRNIEKTERGIIVLDEFDKIAAHGSDVSDIDVQNALLKLMDGYKYVCDMGKMKSDITIDTTFMTIAACGAFPALFKKKEKTGNLGFRTEEDQKIIKKITTDDFVEFGMLREIMGRITQVYQFAELDKDSLRDILIKSANSPLILSRDEYLATYNTDFEWTEEYIDYIVEMAYKSKKGGRGLKEAITYSLIKAENAMYKAHHKNPEKKLSLKVTKDTVEDNTKFQL